MAVAAITVVMATDRAAPASSTLAPVLNRGTLDLSPSRLSDRTLKTIQTNPTTAKTGSRGRAVFWAAELIWVCEAGVDVIIGIRFEAFAMKRATANTTAINPRTIVMINP